MDKIFSGFTKSRFSLFFWISFVMVLPFVFSTRLIDEDSFPKLIFIAALMTILAARSILNSTYRSFDRTLFVIILFSALYFVFSFRQSDLFSAGITSLFILILPFYFLLLMRSNKLFIPQLIYSLIPISATILCLIAIFQYLTFPGKDFQPVHLIRATMSNKNFLSEALIMYLVICLGGSFYPINSIRKLNIAAIILIVLTILLLQTMSAYLCLGFLVVFLIPVLIYFNVRKESRKKIILRFFVPGMIILVATGFFALRLKIFGGVKTKIVYAAKIISGEPLPPVKEGLQNSIYERLYLWKNSMMLFKENPAVGIGLSNWQIYWPKYGMQGASYLDAAIMRYEHPHNEYVLLLTESGIVGIICYAFFFIFIIITGLRIVFGKNNADKRQVAIMLGGILCMALLSLFGYPLHRPFTISMCMVMCLIILESGETLSTKKFNSRILAVLLLVFSLFSFNIYANRISGEYHFSKALMMQSRGTFGNMLREIRQAENKYFTTDNSSTPLDWYKGFAMFYQQNDSAMYFYKLSELQNPYHVQTLSDIGALLENQGKHDEAIIYFKRVLSIVPNYYQAHYNMAVAYFNLNKPAEALDEINARLAIGEEYQNTLDVILARNAELAIDSCDKSGVSKSLLSEKPLLRKINKLSMENNISFQNLICDTIRIRMQLKEM